MTEAPQQVVRGIREARRRFRLLPTLLGCLVRDAFNRTGRVLKHREVNFALEAVTQADRAHPRKLMRGVWVGASPFLLGANNYLFVGSFR